MGASSSKQLFSELTREDVATYVASLGSDYQPYGTLVKNNGVDGELLSEMNPDEFLETLDDLKINDSNHRWRLLKEFQKYAFSVELEGVAEAIETESSVSSRANKQNGQMNDSVVRPAHGPVKEVTVYQMANSGPAYFPSPKELEESKQKRNSAKLPLFQQQRATEDEQSHLAPDFYKTIDSVPGATRPPIRSDDMSRVAQMETYDLDKIDPDSDIGKTLLGFMEMVMKLFDFAFGEITFLNNENMFSMARTGIVEPMDEAIKGGVYHAMSHAANGSPWLCKTDRSVGICNYPHFSKRTFVIHDIHQDETFQWMQGSWPFRCYVGSPLLTASGVVLGTLCLHNLEPRPDFDRACEIQVEQVAMMVVQAIENWKLRRNITRLENTRLALQSNENKTIPPKHKIVIVLTGIENAMSLFQAQPKAMKQALALHNDIVRKLRSEHLGYEASTDGDGFFLAFHDPVDAFAFALNLQKRLYQADWPKDIHALPQACDDGNAVKGLRVKVSVHMGDDITATKNQTSGRMEYNGRPISIAKHILTMAHGGQILTTFNTWNVASFMAESKLAGPQVVDLGVHVVKRGKKTHHGVISERILQLVPSSLSVDYSELSKVIQSPEDTNVTAPLGRRFPDIQSLKKLSASFFDAPGFNNASCESKVTIAFIGTSQIEKHYKEAAGIVSGIIGLAYQALMGTKGYQCQNNMLAFPNVTEAAKFGLMFIELLSKQHPLEDGRNASTLITFGCVHDTFVTLEPHKTTGRADYFGKVVNRAARMAYSSALGSVSVGVAVTPSFEQETFFIEDPTIDTKFVANRKLKGVEGEMAVFECTRRLITAAQ